jgi:hypothetical protein
MIKHLHRFTSTQKEHEPSNDNMHDRVREIACGLDGPSEKNVSPH